MWALIKKELLLEWRAKEILPAFLLLGGLTLIVLSFAFDPASPWRQEAASGAFWVALFFAAAYGFGRSFLAEQANDALHGLLLAPVDRGTIYVAKVTATLAYLLLVDAILMALFILFFNVRLGWHLWPWPLATVLASVGLSALGTLFGAVSTRTRAREIMLPLLLLPLVVPLFLAGVEVTRRAFAARPLEEAVAWLHLMLAFDVMASVVAWALFEYVVQD